MADSQVTNSARSLSLTSCTKSICAAYFKRSEVYLTTDNKSCFDGLRKYYTNFDCRRILNTPWSNFGTKFIFGIGPLPSKKLFEILACLPATWNRPLQLSNRGGFFLSQSVCIRQVRTLSSSKKWVGDRVGWAVGEALFLEGLCQRNLSWSWSQMMSSLHTPPWIVQVYS